MDSYREQVARVVSKAIQLDPNQLDQVELLLDRLIRKVSKAQPDFGIAAPINKDWPHSPLHRLADGGTYMITAGTLHKMHYFRDRASLDFLEAELLAKAKQYGWHLEAWTVFSNHYHFVGYTDRFTADSLREFITHLHSDTARRLNERDHELDRQVWFNFWETRLTYQKSYYARLKYVHWNAVKHGLVSVPNQYRWCSAAWFERTATPAQVKTIYSLKLDHVKVSDDFEPLRVE